MQPVVKHIPNTSAPGIDSIDAKEAKETFEEWIHPMLQAVHHKGYKALPVKRVWIPKPGKSTKRPIGIHILTYSANSTLRD